MAGSQYKKFAHLSFDDFRRMAKDRRLSRYEKIGFPDSYRKGKEKVIFQDILEKLRSLQEKNKTVMDIGPGCGDLPLMLINLCRKNNHRLLLVDSEEMLSQLPGGPLIEKIAGYYPYCGDLLDRYRGAVDVILTYSVLHHVFAESNIWDFLDSCLELLSNGGEMLIGDIPNVSKRKRFFSSAAGIRFHQKFTKKRETPEVLFNRIERQLMDDSVVLALLARARAQGFDAYVVPQGDELPMANRREDIFIRKP